MSLNGTHIAAGYVQGRQSAALLSIITDSVTSAASSGVTAFGGPSALNPPAGVGGVAPAFEVSVVADTFVAIGVNPDAVNGPRTLVRAGTDRPFFCQAGDRLAWTAA
jgi:hypothetical protein